MKYTIHNAVLTAEIDSYGAELCSLRSNLTGTEYIWQADPEIWARHAPLLFPIIGRLKDKQYTVDGQTYDITQHGFARDSEFVCIEQNENSIALSLVISEQAERMYPFPIALTIRYTLDGNRLKKEHITTNKGAEPLYYEIGGHDAFNVALDAGETMQDYYVDFGDRAELYPFVNDENLMLTKDKRTVPLKDGRLYLDPEVFALDALIMDDISPRHLSIRSDKSAHTIRMDFEDFPYVALWTKYTGKATNYVCIEPWTTLPDCAYLDKALENKIGVRRLNAGETEIVTTLTTIE